MLKSFGGFRNIWVVDYEYMGGGGNPPVPICLAAKNLITGEIIQQWLIDDLGRNLQQKIKYSTDNKSLLVSYYSIAEISCHIVLCIHIPLYILDLFTEFRCLTNGLRPISGNSLLGACQYYGIIGTNFEHKELMRKRILQGPPFTEKEQKAIQKYCLDDVLMLEKLFYAMQESIDLPYALIRGRYMSSVAQVEHNGIPINILALQDLKSCWEIIKEELVWRIDQQERECRGLIFRYNVYEGTVFKTQRFINLLELLEIPWDYTPDGHPKLDDNYFKERAKSHPELKALQELRYSIGQLRLNALQIGSDGRNRYMTSPFGSITGRNQPSSSKCIFGNATWIRHLMKPTEGMALGYVDFEQEEFIIGGVLSEDKAMMAAYETGDPYLAFAKSTGAIPPEGTKQSHPEIRDLYKTMMLAIGFGMSAETFSERAGIPLVKARYIYKQHQRLYKKYWDWNQDFCDNAKLSGEVSTQYHWKFQTNKVERPNTLKNWPMQSTGSDILRLATILCIEHNIKVVALVHDALLIEAPIDRIEEETKITQSLMSDASEYVINYRIRTEVKITKYPDSFIEPRGTAMWNTVWDIINSLNPSEKEARIHEKDMKLLDFEPKRRVKQKKGNISNRRKSQLTLKPQDMTEKQLAKRLQKTSNLSYVEVMTLIRAARETDFDLEMEIDWQNTSYPRALEIIQQKTRRNKEL